MMYILIVLLAALPALADKLILIQALWRHGARTPIYCNWNCPYFKDNAMLDGYLTPTGMRQHYILGQWFRKRYITELKFLSSTFNENEILIYSTDVNRTIMSALSNMQGLYPEGTGLEVPTVEEGYLKPPNPDLAVIDFGKKALPFQVQTVPIHMKEQLVDYELRGYGSPTCAKAAEFQQTNQHTELAMQVSHHSQDLIVQFGNEMNIDPSTLSIFKLNEYMDTFSSSLFNGYPMPNLKKETLEQVDQLYPLGLAIKLYQTFDQARMMSTPFFEQLMNVMDYKVKKELDAKYVVYSAHDVTVQLMMIALNLTSAECMKQVYFKEPVTNDQCIYTFPGYASNFIFELYEDDNQKNYVKIMFNGTYQQVCGEQQCELGKFKQILKAQSMDFIEGCGLGMETMVESKVPGWMVTLTVILAMLVVIAIFIILKIIQKNKSNQTGLLQSKRVNPESEGLNTA